MALAGGNSEYCCQTTLDIFCGCGPGRDAYAHRRLPLPDSAATPTGAIRLHSGYHAPGLFSAAEGNQYLVCHYIVEHVIAGLREALGEARCLPAISLD